MNMNKRPVGHITDLIKDIDKWIEKRENKQLNNSILKKVKLYLEEYKEKYMNENKENNNKVKITFNRDIRGFSCEPNSVVAWLYSKNAPELAEDFAEITNRVQESLEKQWQKKYE